MCSFGSIVSSGIEVDSVAFGQFRNVLLLRPIEYKIVLYYSDYFFQTAVEWVYQVYWISFCFCQLGAVDSTFYVVCFQ